MNGETLPNPTPITSKEGDEKIPTNGTAEQIKSKEGGNTPGQTLDGNMSTPSPTPPSTSDPQIDYSQMYDMLRERDDSIAKLKSEVTELKKANTQLLLRVNASSQNNAIKDPFESLIDFMNER